MSLSTAERITEIRAAKRKRKSPWAWTPERRKRQMHAVAVRMWVRGGDRYPFTGALWGSVCTHKHAWKGLPSHYYAPVAWAALCPHYSEWERHGGATAPVRRCDRCRAWKPNKQTGVSYRWGLYDPREDHYPRAEWHLCVGCWNRVRIPFRMMQELQFDVKPLLNQLKREIANERRASREAIEDHEHRTTARVPGDGDSGCQERRHDD